MIIHWTLHWAESWHKIELAVLNKFHLLGYFKQ
jgi:hypothetical protein